MTTSANGPSSSSPYRNEIDALRERKESLEREIARLRVESAELEGLRSREQELARELSAVTHKIGAQGQRRALPLLDNVKVASPCSANWDEMLGDDRVRFCVSCEKNVYNLSAMPRQDAEQLLAERLGGELCVRFYQRADGTLMTQDCPVGVKKKQRKKLALAVAGAGAVALAATTMLSRATCRMGDVAPTVAFDPNTQQTQQQTQTDPTTNTDPGQWRTGDWAGDPVPKMGEAVPTPPPPPPVTHTMGRLKRR